MEISEIKELLLLFDASTLAYLRWERGDERLILRKAPRGSEAADFSGGSGLAGVVSYPEAKPQAIWGMRASRPSTHALRSFRRFRGPRKKRPKAWRA